MDRTSTKDILHQTFGHEAFRGQQQAVIDRLLSTPAGQGHALVLAPTGSGKSLCYQIPAIALSLNNLEQQGTEQRQSVTVVVSPLIALMKDQVDALRGKGVEASYINSSISRVERERRYQALSAGAYQLIYITPERFRKPEFREALSRLHVALLAVDEAHCVSEWGHDFRPDYTRIDDFERSWATRQPSP